MTRLTAPSVDTLNALLELRAAASPIEGGALVMIDERERAWPVSYAELLDRSQRIGAGLQEQGLSPGERVAIMLPTGIEFVASFFGTLLAGGIPVPVAPPFFLNHIEDFLSSFEGIAKSAEPAFLITFKDIRFLAAGAARVTPTIRGVLMPEALAETTARLVEAHPAPSDTCFLQYTSGSTGTPKGVEITHANVLANVRGIGERVEADDQDVCVNWLPLYHDMGLIGSLLTSMFWGRKLVLLSPQQFIKYPIRWLRALDRYRGTVSPAPNFAYRVCLKISDEDLRGLDLRSWRVAFNGAEPVDLETMERFVARFEPHGFQRRALFPVYGLAEGTLAVTHPRLDEPLEVEHVDARALAGDARGAPRAERIEPSPSAVAMVGVGYALPGTEIAILGPSERALGEREIGEIRVRGPAVMKGYYKDRAATHAVLRDGWLATGDLGYLAEGRLFVTGRKKDLLIKAGKNYYPQDVEDAIRKLPEIRRGRVAAFGITDPAQGTERIVALVESDARLSVEEQRTLERKIRAEVARRVGLSLDTIELVPRRTILRTSSGKVRRTETRALYLSGDLVRAPRSSRLSLALAVLRSIWQLGLLQLRPRVAPERSASEITP